MDKLASIGKLGKPHGIKGYIAIHLNAEVNWDKTKHLFIEINGTPVPYGIEDIELLTKKMIVKLNSVSSIEDAKKFINKNIYVPKENIIQDTSDDLIGYTVIDSNNHQVIGKVNDYVSHNNLEWLSVLTKNNKEVLLPFNDDLIVRVDEDSKTLFYKAIDGMY